jgi:hypothetical protein
MSEVKQQETQRAASWVDVDETVKKMNARSVLCSLVGDSQLNEHEKRLVAIAVKQAKQEIVADLIAAGVV